MMAKSMRILGMVAENYKRLRLVEIAPDGRVVMFSGAPDQGKTSCVDAFLSAVGGKRFTQDLPVRKGARKAELKLVLGGAEGVAWHVQRTINPDGTHQVTVTDPRGNKPRDAKGATMTPQAFLDELRGDIWMDPTEFVRMKPKQQVEILRKVAKVEMICPGCRGVHGKETCATCAGEGRVPLDVERMNVLNTEDFEERTAINREVKRLEAELGGMVEQKELPAEKLDEAPVREKLAAAAVANRNVQETITTKETLRAKMEGEQRFLDMNTEMIDETERTIAELTERLAAAKVKLEDTKKHRVPQLLKLEEATKAYEAAPVGEIVDVAPLMAELDQVQVTNREIERRDRRVAKAAELAAKKRESDTLTRAIEGRDEMKRAAMSSAKMPVEGLTFDVVPGSNEEQVLMRGVPLEQLGDAEKIRICTLIAMSEDKPLRVLPVFHGEMLGTAGIAAMAALAEEHDFQIIMALVDESGQRGYVIEDGAVKTVNA